MAVGGLFGRFHDHAQAVTSFGLDVIRYIRIFNEARNASLNVRVGINTGPVVAGRIPPFTLPLCLAGQIPSFYAGFTLLPGLRPGVIGDSKYAFDIWGDAVNVASRMESTSLAGRVQVSRSTYERIYTDFPCEERGEIDVKGMSPFLFS